MDEDIRYGGVVRRLAAAAIDVGILAGAVGLVALPQPEAEPSDVYTSLFVLGSAIAMFYRMVFEGSPMQGTPGKYVAGLRAVHEDGRTMMFVGSALRSWPWWLTGAVAALIPVLAPAVGALCLVAVAPIVWDARRRGLHDRMAGTVVVLRDSRLPAGGTHG